MNYLEKYQLWTTSFYFDEEIRNELRALDPERDREEIEDRFYRDLEFGTGGLRGIMGAGTNRMNRYTVGRASMGLGNYLLDTFGKGLCRSRGVVIAYDTRNHSAELAQTAADVLTGMGIRARIFREPVPTPELSFSVRHLNCVAGIVLTASHNPKEYNGYKVYDEYGCQLVPRLASAVLERIEEIRDYTAVSLQGCGDLLDKVDVTEEFVSAVLRQSLFADPEAKKELNVVYTPLHGTGNVPVTRTLFRAGFSNVNVVPEQERPDGNFSTVRTPNPEERDALNMGISLAKTLKSDIVLGTDPDSDRVGAAVRAGEGEYVLLTGNQIGALLMDYVLSRKDLAAMKKPAVVKTIVTSELGAEIARKKGLAVFSTLTGFKYIGEKITQFETAEKEKDSSRSCDFVMGYEESYGYLVGTHARDKDAVSAVLLLCEMAAEYKRDGRTLLDRLSEIYGEYGFYRDALDSFTLRGKAGGEKIRAMMEALRQGRRLFEHVQEVLDYQKGLPAEEGFGSLPVSDVLKYILEDGSWVAVRPSGTEPKIKVYYSVRGTDAGEAEIRLGELRGRVKAFIEE